MGLRRFMGRWKSISRPSFAKGVPNELEYSTGSGSRNLEFITVPGGLESEAGDQIISGNLDPAHFETQGVSQGSSLGGEDPSPLTINGGNLQDIQTIREVGATAWEVKMIWALKKSVAIKEKAMKTMASRGFKMGGFWVVMILIGLLGGKFSQGPGCEVEAFLDGAGLGLFYEVFISKHYVGLDDLLDIKDEKELMELPMPERADRKRFLRHVEAEVTKQTANESQTPLLVSLLWLAGFFVVGIAAGLSLSLFLFEEARKRVVCCLLWSCFVLWYVLWILHHASTGPMSKHSRFSLQ